MLHTNNNTVPTTELPLRELGLSNTQLVGTFFINNMVTEIWKSIPNFETEYEISNMGSIRSIERTVGSKNGGVKKLKSATLKPRINGRGYEQCGLMKNGKRSYFLVHRLIMKVFNGISELEVDHIDGNRLNNKLSNLEYVSHRENITRFYQKQKTTSRFVGVFWDKYLGKWRARIFVKGKGRHLGCFTSEKDASIAYQKALNSIK